MAAVTLSMFGISRRFREPSTSKIHPAIMIPKVLRNYRKLTDSKLVEKAQHVHDCFAVISPYPSTVMSAADFKLDIDAYNTALGTVAGGSSADILAKDVARQLVESDIDVFADFTDLNGGGNPTYIVSHGFNPTATVHTKVVLTIPSIKSVDNSVSTKLKIACTAVAGAYGYEVELTTGAGVKTVTGGFSDSRNLLVESLTPGTTFSIRVRATGGGNGRGDWSLPVTIMCT